MLLSCRNPALPFNLYYLNNWNTTNSQVVIQCLLPVFAQLWCLHRQISLVRRHDSNGTLFDHITILQKLFRLQLKCSQACIVLRFHGVTFRKNWRWQWHWQWHQQWHSRWREEKKYNKIHTYVPKMCPKLHRVFRGVEMQCIPKTWERERCFLGDTSPHML